ncbi:sulfite oxidase [Paenibacillus thermotolerans]|uniref:sulfite oxidase n=1 Tax=Paenibacillus thermotolerans TaxID=3027807 RepID=UPI00236857E3|nr:MULTISPECIES: sulfite oxidase [unclassified Paenibacillus]
MRNHFPYPIPRKEMFALHIQGKADRPFALDYGMIRSMPSRDVPFVLECAGNKRSFFEPKTYGDQWESGAIVQGVWRGVPLAYLLQTAGVKPSVREVAAEGWDAGVRTDMPGVFPFARSIPLEKAMHPDTIIAYEYNGQPLTWKHGFPFRLIVPHWYGMASVKWVRRIVLLESSFQGPFQSVDYQYYPHKENDIDKFPVTVQGVNSSIQKPLDRAVLKKGRYRIQGFAWTGIGEIKRVEVSFDHGVTWADAKLSRTAYEPNSWVHWEFEWVADRAGEVTILSRSEDTHGRVQPMEAFWNRKGYGYNAADRVTVKIE